ncbi:MAG TPA: peptidoglycan-binding domain-containing protein [Candidatus Binataceae bacterium]|nr:peptidoglycan-binding domain-containing protein [Candidatus Binataceae bacterium]
MRTLSLGMQGCDVGAWQQFLKAKSRYSGSITGRFDDATERATRDFQQRADIEADGVASPATIDRARRDGFIVPQNTGGGGDHFHMEHGVDLSFNGRSTLRRIAERYYMRTCGELRVSSGTRTPEQQAQAMWNNLYYGRNRNVRYANRHAFEEIYETYAQERQARADEMTTVAAMTRVIEQQVHEGTYISRHLRGEAVDILPSGNPPLQAEVLKEVVNELLGSGNCIPEEDHFHIQF